MGDELLNRRWETKRDPSDHKPIDALRKFVDDIETGKIDPNHIVIVYANAEDDESAVGYYQAGDLTYYGSLGLLARCQQIMGGDL